MIDEEDRIAHAYRVLGEEAHSFFNSDLGKFVVARSAETVAENVASLTDVDPEDAKTIRKYQENIAIAKMGLYWINESLNLGDQQFAQDEIETWENEA
jgi:hypothetical protein